MTNPSPATTTYRLLRRIGGRGAAAGQFETALRGVAVDGAERLYAVGDSMVRAFGSDGEPVAHWRTGKPGFSVAVDGGGRVWVGQYRQVEIYDPSGRPLDTWRDPDRLGLVTAIDFGGDDDVFLADAHARWVRRYDRGGRWMCDIGRQHRKGGFHIPNGVVDFAIDGAGVVHVANPGMHRVERYTAGGELLGHFGRFDGRDPAGFPGCCNPTNLALDPGGRVIVTEKAGPRVKAYDAEGNLLAVLADRGFDPTAKNMDVAVDPAGRVFVADTASLEIHVLAPSAEGPPS